MESLLADKVYYDYQDLRGKSGICSKETYVNARRSALDHLKTHHLYSIPEINVAEKHAYCSVSAMIYRQDDNGICFVSHVIYNFELFKLENNEWKFKKIKQSVLWNEGDSAIHQGVPADHSSV